jgi:hypothetical protein
MKGLLFIAGIFQIISKSCCVLYVRRLEDTENLLNGDAFTKKKLKDDKFVPMFKERKKHDRFNGMPEEEVSKRTLPDHLALNLDIVIVSMTLLLSGCNTRVKYCHWYACVYKWYIFVAT